MRTEPNRYFSTEYYWYDADTVLAITGSFGYDSSVLTDLGEYVGVRFAEPDTWQCNYCGTSHWIENKELQCQKCGAPRDI